MEPLGWFGIVRLGLVQTALGAIVVLTTSTLNRIMAVELALPAVLPGLLVAMHYTMQLLRPRWGHGSDAGGRLTPWIIGGMAVLGLGALKAASGTALMAQSLPLGILFAALGFLAVGAGAGAAGTSLLVLLAARTAPHRRAAAATIAWMMMIAGMAFTGIGAGHFLDPYSGERLLTVVATVAALALCVTILAVHGLEAREPNQPERAASASPAMPFRTAFAQVWRDAETRRFTIFLFVSMLAFSAQDLILEPFAALAFGLTPGETTKLAGVQNGGVFAGMALVALLVSGVKVGTLRGWTVIGCSGSAAALAALALAGSMPGFPIRAGVFALGLCNGVFAVAAIGSMMELVNSGDPARRGVRMGLWGAAQAVAFGAGGLVGAGSADVLRLMQVAPVPAYAIVFAAEAGVFLVAAWLAAQPAIATSKSRELVWEGAR